MSTFKEITGNTLTNNGEAISGRLVYTWLGGNESKPVYFGLKDGADSWTGNLSTIATSGFYLTSNVSGCTALVKYDLPTTIDPNTAREIWLNIPSTTTSRTIQFSYNGITVLTVKQTIVIPNKLLICKPTWDIDPYTITDYAIIGFSTSATSIRSIAFDAGQGGTYLKKSLCAIEQLNNPNTIQWMQNTIQQLDTLKYIRGINYKINGMSDYTLIKVIVDTGEEIIENDFDRIKELGIIYIYVRKNMNGDYICVGRITMVEQGEYMLGEIG